MPTVHTVVVPPSNICHVGSGSPPCIPSYRTICPTTATAANNRSDDAGHCAFDPGVAITDSIDETTCCNRGSDTANPAQRYGCGHHRWSTGDTTWSNKVASRFFERQNRKFADAQSLFLDKIDSTPIPCVGRHWLPNESVRPHTPDTAQCGDGALACAC